MGDLKAEHKAEWGVLKETSKKIGDMQASIDQTLDKVRTKMLDRTLEADQLV